MLKKEKSLARPWGSASISAEKRQARESTPDLDDDMPALMHFTDI
jgi:hypothetical protein